MKILVVSPHPDDETLGAGGTLLKHKKMGDQIYWLNITDGKTEYDTDIAVIRRRQKQIDSVKQYYNFNGFYNLALRPAGLTMIDEGKIISSIRVVFDDIKPDWIIIPGQYDAHSDHRVTYNCCMACAKTFRSPYIKRITTMEIVSETDYGFQKEKFEPNLFVDITEEIEGKLEAMKIYDTELEEVPFPRSIENIKALATVRGGVLYKQVC